MSESEGNAKISVTLIDATSRGDKKTFEMEKNASISELKEVVAKHFNAQPIQLRLIFAGKFLKDQDTLATYNIKNGSTVHFVIKTGASQNTTTTTTTTSSTNTESFQTHGRTSNFNELLLSLNDLESIPDMDLTELIDNQSLFERYIALNLDLLNMRQYIASSLLRNGRVSRRVRTEEIDQNISTAPTQQGGEINPFGRMGLVLPISLNEVQNVEQALLQSIHNSPIYPFRINDPEVQSQLRSEPQYSSSPANITSNANTIANIDSTVPDNRPLTEDQDNFTELMSRMRSHLSRNIYPPPTITLYRAQVEDLLGLGFSDIEACLEALNASGGCVNGAAEWLISHGF